MSTVTPTLQDVYAVLQPFIASVTGLSASLVIQGLPNRVAMPPASPGFAVMQAMLSKRLRTNIVTWDKTITNPTTINSEQGVELHVQIDLYGASAGDWAVMMSTLLRDEIGCTALAPTCAPLYTMDPKLAPLIDSEAQYEQRWIVEALVQYNPVTTSAMQFADSADVTLINVDEAYPP